MQAAEFEAKLAQAGFEEITARTMEPRPANEDHTHDFAIRGLVTAGEFIVTCSGERQSYKAGEIFEVAAGTPHNEAVGATGASIITGKLHPTA